MMFSITLLLYLILALSSISIPGIFFSTSSKFTSNLLLKALTVKMVVSPFLTIGLLITITSERLIILLRKKIAGSTVCYFEIKNCCSFSHNLSILPNKNSCKLLVESRLKMSNEYLPSPSEME